VIIKQLIDEDFVNYYKPSMFIGFPSCTFKCDNECGERVCQNSALASSPDIKVNLHDIVNRYISNPITSAIVIGGLEPFDNWSDLIHLISLLRTKTLDDVVVYTGYKEEEIKNQIRYLGVYRNIIVKFGRFIPNQESHYDEVLRVNLASPNQYARRVS
jgi:organic radical activating enzyme